MVIWESRNCVQNYFWASNPATTLCERQSHLDFQTASDQGVRRRFQNRSRCPFRRSIKLLRGHQTAHCIRQQRHPLPINSRDPALLLLFPAFAHTRPFQTVFGPETLQAEREMTEVEPNGHLGVQELCSELFLGFKSGHDSVRKAVPPGFQNGFRPRSPASISEPLPTSFQKEYKLAPWPSSGPLHSATTASSPSP